jgi:hypothetical protein
MKTVLSGRIKLKNEPEIRVLLKHRPMLWESVGDSGVIKYKAPVSENPSIGPKIIISKTACKSFAKFAKYSRDDQSKSVHLDHSDCDG